jgi:hypothetical protein
VGVRQKREQRANFSWVISRNPGVAIAQESGAVGVELNEKGHKDVVQVDLGQNGIEHGIGTEGPRRDCYNS